MMADIDSSQVLFPTLSEAEVKRRSEADRRLPTWLSLPVQFPGANLNSLAQDIDDFTDSIDQELINHLRVNLKLSKLFPVQKCLIPTLAKQFKSRAYRRPNDVCVSSPTGSGKTLAYVIPIVNYLKQSLARELRAIVILPTKDLAQQVFKTFQTVVQPTHVRCAIATGELQDRGFFRKVPKYTAPSDERNTRIPENSLLMANYIELPNLGEDDYVSTIDVLISTPGTLIDMFQNIPGFSLKDLEILVMDEADRLMVNHKHDWLNAIERAVCPESFECPCKDLNHNEEELDYTYKSNFFMANGCTLKHSAKSKPLHKLLFSATLSSDPQLLMQMKLYQPRLFLAIKPSLTSTKIRNSLGSHTSTPSGSPTPYSINHPTPTTVNTKNELLTTTAIPEELEEKMFITEMKDKLYVLWYMIQELQYRKVLCFTNERRKSWELCIFINEITNVRATNFSSDTNPEARLKYMNEFKKGQIDVIVATDLAGRGMDIDGIEYVISYDMPQSATWYAHRVGRTARAGKKGTAITLVDSKQLVQFKKIVQHAHKMPNSMRLSDVVEEMKIPHFSQKDDKRDIYMKTFENYRDKLNTQKNNIKNRHTNKH